jgi:hypothetical protein
MYLLPAWLTAQYEKIASDVTRINELHDVRMAIVSFEVNRIETEKSICKKN